MENRARHRQGFLVLLTLLIAWVTVGICAPVLAESFDDRYMEGTAHQDDSVSRTFDTLRALGEASNTGGGEEEALRQACALFQDQGSAALQAALTEKLRNPSLLSGFSSSKIGSTIYAQGQGAIGSAFSSACAALSGGGMGGVGFLDPDHLKDMAFSYALDEGLGAIKSSGLPFATNLEVTGGLFGNGGSSWEVLSVQPLWHDADKQNHIFTQLSWNRTNDRAGYADGDTINAGLAWRRLTDDRTMVYGLNTFFDHALDMNHNRMSIGADVQTAEIGVSANKYFPLSDWKSVDDYIEERASSGFDVELQGRLPQFPAWQTSLKGYQWSSNTDMEQETTFGYDAALQWQPVNAMIWEAGIRDEQDSEAELHTALRLMYRVGDSIEEMWKRPTELPSMEDRVYGKVRRDNAMRVEQRIKDSAYVIVTETTGANSAALADGTSRSLSTGLQLPRPMTVTVSAAGGSVARLTFRDGATLTIGAGSQVRIESTLITLLSGSLHYVSGTQNVVLAAPGATVTLLGTDVDLSTNGTDSTLRVRDGRARIAGTTSGTTTLNPTEAAESVSGVVGVALATNDPDYIAHTDTISEDIDRVASPLEGTKIAPYPVEEPRLTATTTTPGQPITIGLRFNDIVTVAGGTPRLVLDINGNTRHATLSGGSGTNDLAFTYTLQAGDGGATTATVQSLDLNGSTITGNGKNAVTTIADAILNLGGSVSDIVAPSGYAVAFTTDPISISNHTAAAFQITGAEIGATFDYTISSSNGGTDVTGSGTITTATQNVTALDVSGLADGTLTVSLTLTDAATNTGAAATDTVTKTVIALSLDFVNGAYSLNGTAYGSFTAIPGATFTRASPATTYAEDSAGNLVAFAANTPRITNKGILIEGGRINRLVRSQEFNITWNINGSLTPNVTTAPDGTMTADKLIVRDAGAGLQYHFAQQSPALSPSTTYTKSVYAKAGELNWIVLQARSLDGVWQNAYFNLSTGTVGSITGGGTANITQAANGFYRCELTFSSATGATGNNEAIVVAQGNNNSNFVGDATSGVYIWGAQLEQGAFASSYIPTTAAAVTRDSDDAYVSYAFPTEHSLYASATNITPATGVQRWIVSAGLPLAVGHGIFTTTADGSVMQVGVSNIGDQTIGLGSIPSTWKVAAARRADSKLYMSTNGQSPVFSTNIIASPTRLNVGQRGPNQRYIEGYLRDTRVYPSAYTDSQLQTLTTP